MKNIIITGGAGFIGSHVVDMQYKGVNKAASRDTRNSSHEKRFAGGRAVAARSP